LDGLNGLGPERLRDYPIADARSTSLPDQIELGSSAASGHDWHGLGPSSIFQAIFIIVAVSLALDTGMQSMTARLRL
jgi:hypothetical protein